MNLRREINILEIPIAVTVKWDDKNAIDILRKKVEEVSYPLEEDDRYNDESKDILNLILNDDASTDSDGDVEELLIKKVSLNNDAFN